MTGPQPLRGRAIDSDGDDDDLVDGAGTCPTTSRTTTSRRTNHRSPPGRSMTPIVDAPVEGRPLTDAEIGG